MLEGYQALSTIYEKDIELGLPDKELTEIVLPVYHGDGKQEEKNLIPGAPMAFSRNQLQSCPTIQGLQKQMDSHANRNYAEGVKEYFAKHGPHIKSFVSIPIPSVSERDKNLGVLNIHSNLERILHNGAKLFWPVIRPFTFELARLLEQRP